MTNKRITFQASFMHSLHGILTQIIVLDLIDPSFVFFSQKKKWNRTNSVQQGKKDPKELSSHLQVNT